MNIEASTAIFTWVFVTNTVVVSLFTHRAKKTQLAGARGFNTLNTLQDMTGSIVHAMFCTRSARVHVFTINSPIICSTIAVTFSISIPWCTTTHSIFTGVGITWRKSSDVAWSTNQDPKEMQQYKNPFEITHNNYHKNRITNTAKLLHKVKITMKNEQIFR